MLNAILESKSGRLNRGDDHNVRWRDIFKESEDLVTSTIFERLSYLPAITSWEILATSARGRLPTYRMADLKNIEFWPMWAVTDRTIGVEPDVFMNFELGDPPQNVHIIVEAKHGGVQTVGQLFSEVKAWCEAVDNGVIEQPDQVIILAIGGLPAADKIQDLEQSFSQAVTKFGDRVATLRITPIGWDDIAKATAMYDSENKYEKRILNDISSALELFGYYYIVKPTQLEQLIGHRPINRKLSNILMNLNCDIAEKLSV